MGAHRQKWTSEEEAALKAGVVKHGAGKWSTILKDPEFNHVLYNRSNIDLKDKWRNLSVKANGWTSKDKEKSQVAIETVHHHAPKQDDNSMAVTLVTDEILDVYPLKVSKDTLQIPGLKRSIGSLDNLIMEAISSLNELGGSNKTTIASFIKDQYCAPADFKKVLSAKLEYLTSSGKLIKVKHRYRIVPTPAYLDRGIHPPKLLLEGRQKASMKFDRDESNIPTKYEIDLELFKIIRSMSAQEVAAYAARAVAEAEAATEEAEEAEKEAEAAEADADSAAAIAKAAKAELKSLKGRKPPKTVNLGFSFRRNTIT